MSNHHLQDVAENITNKEYGSTPYPYGKSSFQTGRLMASGDLQMKLSRNDGEIQNMAFQIHLAYGGSDIDNWLEAEQILKNDEQAAFNFINEGNPNTQI